MTSLGSGDPRGPFLLVGIVVGVGVGVVIGVGVVPGVVEVDVRTLQSPLLRRTSPFVLIQTPATILLALVTTSPLTPTDLTASMALLCPIDRFLDMSIPTMSLGSRDPIAAVADVVAVGVVVGVVRGVTGVIPLGAPPVGVVIGAVIARAVLWLTIIPHLSLPIAILSDAPLPLVIGILNPPLLTENRNPPTTTNEQDRRPDYKPPNLTESNDVL